MKHSETPLGYRMRSLDILRGLTVAFMIIVNNPGSGANRFDCLRHSPWNGCTPTDLVFPFFLFIVGASVWFAFRKYGHTLSKSAARKILCRGFSIWAVGILVAKFPYYNFCGGEWISWDNVRILGVLPRIGLAYMFGAFIVLTLKKRWRIIAAGIALMTLYEILVYSLGDATLEGYFGRAVDLALFGEKHVYHGYGCAFDPEGLMSTMTATVNVLWGYLAAQLIGEAKECSEGMKSVGMWGGIAILTALALNTLIPINKPIWSATYVLYTCGIAAVVWNIVSWITDRTSKPLYTSRAFEVFGTNALASYVLSTLYVKIFAQIRIWNSAHENLIHPYSRWYQILADATTPEIGSLLCAVSLVALCWLTVYPLYHKKIFLKL